jgi:glycosyltransferase involved in cell wall biosynthesis
MRIAICSDQYLPLLSGLVDSIETLSRELRRRGHSVRIYAPTLPGAQAEERVCRFPSWTLPGSGDSMIVALPLGAMKDMRAFRPDVIHTHLAGVAGLFALYASRRLSVPLVGTDHTLPADYLHYAKLNWPPFPYLVRKFSAWYYNRCVFVTTPGTNVLDELKDYGMQRPSRIISNPLPTQLFWPLPEKDALKRKLGIGKRAVLVFGRIAKEKNLDLAIDVFARMSEATELVFIGDGPYRSELEKKIREKGLQPSVRFLGVLRGEPLVEAVNACDVCLITSVSETQSLTTLQALACGLPVVAANAGGPTEYVLHGKTGYLIEPADAAAFAEHLTNLLDEPDTRAHFGRDARESVSRFSPEHIAGEFEAVYRDCIEVN